MAWTNLTFNFGAVLTSAQMTQLDDNFEAQAAGDSGAPTQAIAGGGTGATTEAGARTNLGLGTLAVQNTINQSDIDAASVGRAQLITATDVSQSGTLPSESGVLITLDAYSFFPMIHATDVYEDLTLPRFVGVSPHTTDGASADAPRFRLINTAISPETYDVDYRYIGA